MKARLLKKGDTIGIVAASEPVTEDIKEDIERSVKKIQDLGLKVKFAKHVFQNPTGYGETAKHKAEDINAMFEDKEIARYILCYGRF